MRMMRNPVPLLCLGYGTSLAVAIALWRLDLGLLATVAAFWFGGAAATLVGAFLVSLRVGTPGAAWSERSPARAEACPAAGAWEDDRRADRGLDPSNEDAA